MKKVFIITGTSNGIGRYLAEYFLAEGHMVAGCSRGKSKIKDSNYNHYQLSVDKEDEVISMVKTVFKKHGRIDVLLNNAGIASMNHILTTSFKSTKNIFDTNFFGTFLFSREVAKVMIKKNIGNIVNFTTIAVPMILEGEAIYAASKSAIENFTKVSAKELGKFGIRVNAIGPTPVATNLIKNIKKDKIDNLIKKQTISRLGKFEDIINVINFFINKKSDFITGQVIYLGGVN